MDELERIYQQRAEAKAFTRKAIEDNQYLAEVYRAGRVDQDTPMIKPDPVIEPEPTVEDLKKRMERKLDLSD